MNKIKYPYSRPNVTETDIKSVIKVLRSQYLAQGSVVKDFENQISKKFNVKNTIVCNSGTAALHSVYKCLGLNKENGLIINAGGYTHTSVAIHDALKILKIPIIELHISNIYNREEFRHKSLISKIARGVICGFGENGYIMALDAMRKYIEK